jgi:hypothetical protein
MNDRCSVEQKNWPVAPPEARPATDTLKELQALRDLYRLLRPYVDFFQPPDEAGLQKEAGAKVTERFDQARTAYQRSSTPQGDPGTRSALLGRPPWA